MGLKIASFLVFLLPSCLAKNWLLNRLGHKVDGGASVGAIIFWCDGKLHMEGGAFIGSFNVVKNIRLIKLAPNAYIGKMNFFSSHPAFNINYFYGGVLFLGTGAKITDSHWIDCSAGIFLSRFCSIAGKSSILMSHAIDFRVNAQSGQRIKVGAYSFVGAGCILLAGSFLPDRSVLGAGSALYRNRASLKFVKSGLWLGVPAALVGPVGGDWFSRIDSHTRDIIRRDTGKRVIDVI